MQLNFEGISSNHLIAVSNFCGEVVQEFLEVLRCGLGC